MYRQILGYIPANVIPALISVVMIYAYTRLLSPDAFGAFTYVFTAVLIFQTSLFYAIPVALMRFFPGAVRAGRRNGLLKEAFVAFAGLSAGITILFVAIGLFVPIPESYRLPALLGLPVLLLRSLVQLNQAINRSDDRMRHFNTIECLHACLGFGLGIAAIWMLRPGTEEILLGLLVAALVCAVMDFRLVSAPFRKPAPPLDRQDLIRLIAYAWPLVAVAATTMILQNSDRFLIGSLAGTGMLGVYAVAYNLVERPTTLICNSISTATFPLVVQVLEHEGKAAARMQAGRNGIALLAVALPACVGLALSADYITATLVGPAFREGAAALIPIMSFTALARGIRSHFIDHAFHLSGKPLLMLWTYIPVTVVNIALNVYVVPRYGMMGAAWTALGCQWATVIGGWFLGTSLFPVWLPVWQFLRCMLAVIPMAAVLKLVDLPLDWGGLIAAVFLGAAVYGVGALLLDVGDMRTLLAQRVKARLRGRVPVLTE